MILKRLRRETSEVHARLEARLPLVNPDLSREEYRGIVAGFYGIYLPLEERLRGVPFWEDIALDFSERRKVGRLEQDLAALGLGAQELARIPQCLELPELDSIARVLGCFYVVEGATLGGQVISRHLLTNLGITPESGGAFFAGYGAETGPRWKAFEAAMTAAAEKFGDEDEIVASATRTFETLERWLFPDTAHSVKIAAEHLLQSPTEANTIHPL
jgi:heme oxygenase (biliverdin-IX-beta and delta-forming)